MSEVILVEVSDGFVAVGGKVFHRVTGRSVVINAIGKEKVLVSDNCRPCEISMNKRHLRHWTTTDPDSKESLREKVKSLENEIGKLHRTISRRDRW